MLKLDSFVKEDVEVLNSAPKSHLQLVGFV